MPGGAGPGEGDVRMRFEIDQTQCKLERPCQKATRGNDSLWYVEIETLEELMALIAEVGEWIIVKPQPSIEVYNNYRE